MNYHEFIDAYPTLSAEVYEYRDGDLAHDRDVAERFLYEFLNGIDSNLAAVNAIRAEARKALEDFAPRSAAFREVANRGLIDDDQLAEEWLRSMLPVWDKVACRLEELLRPGCREFFDAYPTLSAEVYEYRDGDLAHDRDVAERFLDSFCCVDSNLERVNAIRAEARIVLEDFAPSSAAFREVANRGLIDDDRLAKEWLHNMLPVWDGVARRLEEMLRPVDAAARMIEPSDVLAAIRPAFPTGPIPQVAVNAPEPLKTEAAAFARTLQGKTWTSVTLSDLRGDLFGIFGIDDKSYRYYLPAYLSFATTDYHRMDFVVETLLQSLTSPDYGALTDDDLAMLRKGWESSSNAAALDKTLAGVGSRNDKDADAYKSRMRGLTKPQLEAVKLFLAWLRQEHGDDDANSYISKAEISILELIACTG